MAEQEKKQEALSYAERLAQVMQSMKGKPLPTDFDELDSPMTEELVNKLHEGLRRNRK